MTENDGDITDNVMISIITHESIKASTVQWLCDMAYVGYTVDVVHTPSLIEHQRNTQVKRFLTGTSFKYLFMLDSDTLPHLDTIEELYKHRRDKVVMVAPCLMYDANMRVHPMAFMRMGENQKSPYSPMYHGRGIHEIKGAGMTGALLPRELLEEMEPPWFRMEHDKEGMLILTEDFYFWRKVENMGWRIKANLDIVADHLKPLWLSGMPAPTIANVTIPQNV